MSLKGIYIIKNKINNKVYVGESLSIENRWLEHIKDLLSNKHHSYKLQEDFNKYGLDNFEFKVIEELELRESAYKNKCVLIVYEDMYIKKYNSIEEGYNIENTLEKIIKGEISIVSFLDISEKSRLTLERHDKYIVAIIGRIKRNIKENGKYLNKKGEKIVKRLKQKELKNIAEKMIKKKMKLPQPTTSSKNKKGKVIEPLKIKLSSIPNDINLDLSMKEVIYLITQEVNLYISYNSIFKLFRENNIFEYKITDDNRKYNIPCKEYIEKNYFYTIETKNPEGKEYLAIKVTPKGREFVKEKLIEFNLNIDPNK